MMANKGFLNLKTNELIRLVNNATFDSEGFNIDDFERYINSIAESKPVKDLLARDPQDIYNIINSDDFADDLSRQIFGETKLDFIPEKTLDVFAQKKRSFSFFYQNNSDEFNAIYDAICDINGSAHEIGGVPLEKYKTLYEKCATYVNSRKPDASSDAGKERFKAAADIMRKIGLDLRKEAPEMAESIDKQFRLTSIRSKDFRDALKKESKEPDDIAFADAIDAKLQGKQLTDTIETEQKADALFFKYGNEDKLAIENEKHEAQCDMLHTMANTLANSARTKFAKGNFNAAMEELTTAVYAQFIEKHAKPEEMDSYLRGEKFTAGMNEFKPAVEYCINHVPGEKLTAVLSGENLMQDIYKSTIYVMEHKDILKKANSEYLAAHENERSFYDAKPDVGPTIQNKPKARKSMQL